MQYYKMQLLLAGLLLSVFAFSQDSTYAEKLGFPRGSIVIILHVDDAGMSFDSNEGVELAMEKGIASSTSVMMPCAWVSGFLHYLQKHPQTDAGLHLTLTSEWNDYRWGPVSGKSKVPGLVDAEGAFWHSVEEVVAHASADEVETEIRAQIEKARTMGFEPTHMDSHMGTLFASLVFMERYVKLGIEYHIPLMFPGGQDFLIGQQMKMPDIYMQMIRKAGRTIWDAGLPVLDDLHNLSYDWILPKNIKPTKENWRKFKTSEYIRTLGLLKPGLTMVIMHCTRPSEIFRQITSSGAGREADLMAMLDPELKNYITSHHIIITTWRQVNQMRNNKQKGI